MRHFILAAAVAFSGSAWAKPGAVDSSGCNQSAKLGYHCHPEKAGSAQEARSKVQAVKEEDRRLKRECKGRPNAGACAGYAS